MSDYFSHANALVESQRIGKKTRIWAFTHVLPGAVIGEDCNLCDHVFIENDVVIGNRVTIKSGVQLWDGTTIEDDVFIGPNATFTNDDFPRSKQYPKEFLPILVKRGASIGANATILPGITIGQCAMIGAGAVVTKNVPHHAIVVGNPARIIGYVNSLQHVSSHTSVKEKISQSNDDISVKNVKLYELPQASDLRGSLTVAEYSKSLPFVPQRVFMVFDVPSKDVRGEHAHRTCHQFLICVKGSCAIVVDDGISRAEISLDRPSLGLYLPPMVWGTQYKYSHEAVLMVLASALYDPNDYIRDYDTFLKELHA
ncbi:MAG: WxcM-like domain-containing protein [Bacteroidetes bacterium]|nr:WxcM-like domain-containing protein [Bacteroidota bacterium]